MSDAILDVQGLVGGYGKMTILNGTSFSVPAGSITTVIGPNGAGKSTVFKAIFGLLKLREGKDHLQGARRHRPEPAPTAGRRHLLRAAGAQHLSRAVGAPQYRARRASPPGATSPICRRASRPRSTSFRCCARRRRSRPRRCRAASRSSSRSSRGLLLDPQLVLIDEPSIGLSPLMVQQTFNILQGVARPRRLDPDDRAERALGAGDFRLRHRARTRPDPHLRQGRPRFSTIPASDNCSSAAPWRTARHEQPMRIGVAGAGLIGRKHIELIEASRDCVVAGIADPSADGQGVRRGASASPGIPIIAQLLRAGKARRHDRRLAQRAASGDGAGLHRACGVPALIEKPVTDTVAAAQQLLRGGAAHRRPGAGRPSSPPQSDDQDGARADCRRPDRPADGGGRLVAPEKAR